MSLLALPAAVLGTAFGAAGTAARLPLEAATRARRAGEVLWRLPDLLVQIEGLVGRIDRLTRQAETVLATSTRAAGGAEDVVRIARTATERAEELLGTARRTLASTGDLTRDADIAFRDVDELVVDARSLIARSSDMLLPLEGPARDLTPLLGYVSKTLEPAVVDAAMSLLNRMPQVLDRVENDVLPLLATLNEVEPELQSILQTAERIEPIVDDVRRTLSGLRGVGLFGRRGGGDKDDDQNEDATG